GSTWYDSANFGEAVKRALKNRSAIEEAYINVEDQIKDQRRVESCGERSETVDVAAPSPLLSLFSVIPWNKKTKKKPLEELLKEADDLRKELMFSNNQVDREWERWQSSRVEEMAMNMATLTSAYMEYWCGVAKAWRETVVHLQQTRQLSPKSVSTVSLP
uniref:DHC_N2 domain-containing protein n=2 Tax=Mesocestoides corti TaxID=53468 RepID=A0A5K3G4V2_MESCO